MSSQASQTTWQRLRSQRVFFRRVVNLGQTVSVMYGPVPHSAAPPSVALEPHMYQVVWTGFDDDAWPDNPTDFLLTQQQDDNNKVMVWIPPTAIHATALLRTNWKLDVQLPSMDN